MVDLDKDLFAANLDRLMTRYGYSNSALARNLGVTRQMVWAYRHKGSLPSEERLQALMRVFNCPRSEFAKLHLEEPLLSLQRWAIREQIPYARAVDLFKLGILEGAVFTPQQVFVSPKVVAPPHSKRLVLLAKRRPSWVGAFTVNFEAYMTIYNIKNADLAKTLDVTTSAVANWRSGASYPTISKLPIIAQVLGCSYEDLLIDAGLGLSVAA